VADRINFHEETKKVSETLGPGMLSFAEEGYIMVKGKPESQVLEVGVVRTQVLTF